MSYSSTAVEADPQFLNDFAQGDETGLSRLYNLYSSPLIKCGLRIVHDHFAVENIVNDAFLKAWSFRQSLTSSMHAYRFMRMNVKWDCYDYYRRPENRQVVYPDRDDYPDTAILPYNDEESSCWRDEEMLQSIYNIIPYLPPNRQTILQLYFKYGFSYKQIAKRYGSSVQAITNEIHEGLAYLKKVIHAKKQLTAPAPTPLVIGNVEECLTGEMLVLFKLRFESKLSFESIAAKMNLPQPYVQQQYVAAHAKLNGLKTSRRR
jgi:RNA polymerase sigma factor (sigma-70 family)